MKKRKQINLFEGSTAYHELDAQLVRWLSTHLFNSTWIKVPVVPKLMTGDMIREET